jgi:hypothetical protein
MSVIAIPFQPCTAARDWTFVHQAGGALATSTTNVTLAVTSIASISIGVAG